MKRVIVSVAALLAAQSPVVAQEIPRYDPEKYCRDVANAIGGSAVIYNSCVGMEQSAYDALKARWTGLPVRPREYCDEVAKAIGGTYQILSSCIDQELQAQAAMPRFQF